MNKQELRNIFSKNLRRQLALNDKTQADLSKYMNVSTATVSDWCNCNAMPRMDKIIRIASWLGVGVDELLEDKRQEKYTVSLFDDELGVTIDILEDIEPSTRKMLIRMFSDMVKRVKESEEQTITEMMKHAKKGEKDAKGSKTPFGALQDKGAKERTRKSFG